MKVIPVRKWRINRVLQYLSNVCKLSFSKCRGHSYDMSGRYKGMQQNLLETNKFAILKNKNVFYVLLLFIFLITYISGHQYILSD